MHKAPTVDYPVGPSLFQTLALLVLWLCVAGVDFVWWIQSDRIDWRHAAGGAVTLGAAAVAFRTWQLRSNGILQWDGQSWWWDSGGTRVSGELKPRLDLQSVLLLDFSAHTGFRKWLWLERQTAPSRWSALRRAVHAPAQVDTGATDGSLPLAKQTQQGGTAWW
jgi:toxin CptA